MPALALLLDEPGVHGVPVEDHVVGQARCAVGGLDDAHPRPGAFAVDLERDRVHAAQPVVGLALDRGEHVAVHVLDGDRVVRGGALDPREERVHRVQDPRLVGARPDALGARFGDDAIVDERPERLVERELARSAVHGDG